MKKLIYLSAIVMIGLFACKGNENKGNESEGTVTENSDSTAVQGATYACPMDCEHGKVYDHAGSCPECGMDLEIKS